MAEETQAISSPAEVADPFKGETPSLDEYNKYRQDGELPERFKAVAELAPDDTQEETDKPEAEEPEPEPESDPDDTQEPKPVSKRDKRIQQLLDEAKELKRQLAAKQDVKTEPSPVEPQATRLKPKIDDKKADGTPRFAEYEDYIEELADWKAEQRLEADKRTQAQQAKNAALQAKLDEARTRYDDADEVVFPTEKDIMFDAQIIPAIKDLINGSDMYVDLLYVIGGDKEDFINLAKKDPRAAVAKIFEYERGIKEELSKTTRGEDGKFVSKTVPEKKTNAPKPPSPVGGASSRAFDVSDESLSPEAWMQKRNQQLERKA